MNLIKMKIYAGLVGSLAASFFNGFEAADKGCSQTCTLMAAEEEIVIVHEEKEITERVVSDEERQLLERIVYWEARGEDLEGQILIVNVILNRMENSDFPDSIVGVIFQENQFSSVKNGTLPSAEITEMNMEAVREALLGIDYSQGALYFRAVIGMENSWHEKALVKVTEHGGHAFYR